MLRQMDTCRPLVPVWSGASRPVRGPPLRPAPDGFRGRAAGLAPGSAAVWAHERLAHFDTVQPPFVLMFSYRLTFHLLNNMTAFQVCSVVFHNRVLGEC